MLWKRIHIIFSSLLLVGSAFSQSKTDSVHFNHTEMNALNTKTLYVRSNPAVGSSCTYQIKKAQLKAYLNMGDIYKYGSTSFSGEVTLKVEAYTSFSGASGLYDTWWIKLTVNQGKPEEVYIKDFTTEHALINRFEVKAAAYTSPGSPFTDSIQADVFFDEDFAIGVTATGLTKGYPSNIQLNSNQADTVKFKWKRNDLIFQQCRDIPNYEFQLLRLYNTDSARKTETNIVAKVDWNQALTIETASSDTTLGLHITEGTGYYTWRVRSIGTAYEGGIADSRNWGNWSAAPTQGTTYTITAVSTDYFYYTQFDDTLNWIYSRTFSEGDPASPKVRMSEKITYANGLQQVKQSQAFLPSQQQMVISQTVYDWSGRPAIASLPAPLSWNTDSMKYRTKAMKFGSNVYSSINFDEDTNYTSPKAATGLIENYYSNNNSDTYVPNSEGYPFSRALYERDGTGRVKEQGGPGSTHRIRTNNVRTTRTFYGGVSEKELLRVFGDEAPEAQSVHKVVNVDANSISSISYVDKAGQTIATCLAKIDSTMLDTLPSQGGSAFTVNDTIKGNAPYGQYGIYSSRPLVLAIPTTVTFSYHIGAKDIRYLCMNYCKNCDYKIEILVRSDNNDSVVTKLITSANCTSPKPHWDTTFSRLLNAGSYMIEKRVYANNIKPNSATDSTSSFTYLDEHLKNLRKQLQDTADAKLSCAYQYLNTNNLNGFYQYCLTPSVTVTGVSNPDSVFADSVRTINIKCGTVTVPILFCKGYDCSDSTPDFEAHFNKRWAGTHHIGTTGGFLNYFKNVKSLGGTGFGYRPGQFNKVIDSMIAQNGASGYNCQQLWKCWDRIVQTYASMDTISDTTSYDLDLLREFLNCTGTKYKGYASAANDSAKWKYKPYEYFKYTRGNVPDCDTTVSVQWGYPLNPSDPDWAQDSLYGQARNQHWRLYRDCEENYKKGPTTTTATSMAKCGCEGVCEDRLESFKLAIIKMYHNDSLYVQGDKYYLRKDSTWGQKYEFSATALPGSGITYISMSKIECAAQRMVENCKTYCAMTTYTHGNPAVTDSVGSAAEKLKVEKAMTWSFEVKRPSCGAGWDAISPLSTSGDTSFRKIWERHYGGTDNEELWDIAEDKYACGGYLLVGKTHSQGNNDVTDSLCGRNATYSDYWIIRVNQDGTKMWDKRYGGTNTDVARSTFQTRDGGWLLSGNSHSGAQCEKSEAGRDSADYWVLKLDPLGNVQWNKTFGGTNKDWLESVVETKEGHILLGGYSNSGAGGDKTDGSQGGYDGWFVKLNHQGTKLWDTTYGTSNDDFIYSVRQAKDGNYVWAGSKKDPATYNFWLTKTDPSGNMIGGGTYGGSDDEFLHSFEPIEAEGDSGFILAGTSESYSNGMRDYWVTKISKSFSQLWSNNYGGTEQEGELGGCVDASGNDRGRYIDIKEAADKGFIIGGSSKSPIYSTYKTDTLYGTTYDYWIVRIDSSGTKKWDRSFGGTNDDYGSAMDVDHTDNFWVAGYSKSSNTGNKTVTNYGATTTTDFWVLRGRQWCSSDTLCFRWVKYKTSIPDTQKTALNYISCDSISAEVIKNSIRQQVGQYIDAELEVFKQNYFKTCANPDSIRDTFALAYSLKLHHYTLFFYDRAQNLVRTVPPAGVVTYTLATRSSGTTSHTFKTKYKYNSLKQLVQQETPDGGLTEFWYDHKGQQRFSRNAKQKLVNKYSYTKYDNLGRIIEVGQSGKDGSTTFYDSVNVTTYPGSSNAERVYTVYTTPGTSIYYIGMLPQRYLLNRISYTYNDNNIYTYYSYDPHGNVEWLIQDVQGLGKNYVRYEYDLVSNKVMKVHYNEGAVDEFHHKYTYDEDQRIKTAMTAWGSGASGSKQLITGNKRQNLGWDLDGSYVYFKHGPLKRLEIGEDKIQGLDYVYTLQGWLKGINYPTLTKTDDPGGDGQVGSKFPEDAFGMVLGYHANDFNRSGSKYNPSNALLVSSNGGISNLYNGNITSWTSQTDTISGNYTNQMGMKYRYDQLHRIKTEDYNEYTSGAWGNPANTLDNTYTYDGNGRILTMTRKGTGNDRDVLTANYYASTNRLEYVDDAANSGNYSVDLDDQSSGNYTYSAIGERITDTEGGITSITWTAYGKMETLKRSNGDSLIFTYDAQNNRVRKRKRLNAGTETITYYIRDAQGNILAMYDRTTSGSNYVYTQKEVPIYGSDRLGGFKPNMVVWTIPIGGSCCGNCTSCQVFPWSINVPKSNGYYGRSIAKKEYELKDHLDNVHVTASDRKTSANAANLLSYTNYYAFGTELTGKVYNSTSYSFGYNGKIKDDDIFNASGTFYDYGERGFDARGIPVFCNIDPIFRRYPELSPYSYAANNPILYIDYIGNGPEKLYKTIQPEGYNAQYTVNQPSPFGTDEYHGLVTPPSARSGSFSQSATAVKFEGDAKPVGVALEFLGAVPPLISQVTEKSRDVSFQYNKDKTQISVTTVTTLTVVDINDPSKNKQTTTTETENFNIQKSVQAHLFTPNVNVQSLQKLSGTSSIVTKTGDQVKQSTALSERVGDSKKENIKTFGNTVIDLGKQADDNMQEGVQEMIKNPN